MSKPPLAVILVVMTLGVLVAAPTGAAAQGTLMLVGSEAAVTKEARTRFARLAKGPQGKMMIVTTASRRASMVAASYFAGPWEGDVGEIVVRHATKPVAAADGDAQKRAAERAFDGVTAVWFVDGEAERLRRAYSGSAFAKALQDFFDRGGVVAAVGHAARAIAGQEIAGLDLLAGAQVRSHLADEDAQAKFEERIEAAQSGFGFVLDGEATVVVRGRQVRVRRGSLRIVYPSWRPAFTDASKAAERPRTRKVASGERADLVEVRRTAAARRRPPREIGATGLREDLEKGSLMIVGGGRLSPTLWKRFVELAGGPEAKLIVVPTAGGDRVEAAESFAALMLRRAGAKSVRVWHAPTRRDADDEEFCRALEAAGGVWFSGGRQWRLVDRYEGTRALRLFGEVIRRGGVVGGSSAGCSIHAQCMVRGSPLGNREMLAEGYEHGFGFLGGAAVDQHFSQRKREPDLRRLVAAYPALTGIGIDESTALVVRRDLVEACGAGAALILEPGREPLWLRNGETHRFAR